MYGWAGKILRVNLTNGKIGAVPTSDYVPTYLGGRGLGARLYWEEVPPDVGAFAPGNRLIFVTGPLQGTLAPTSGRFMVTGKAAQTAPTESYCRSAVGGHWAPELKWAGFDAVVVYGRSPKPVYIMIHDEKAEIKEATHLWGMDPFSTQQNLWRVHGKETRVMTIGKAGEMKSRMGIIITDSGDVSGQGGYGGVMGSKNLKALAVRGTGWIQVARPKELMDVTHRINSLFSRPSKPGSPLEPIEPGFKYNIWGGQDRGQVTGAPGELWDLSASPTSGYKRAPDGCYACPIGCRTRVSGPDIPSGVAQCVQSLMYMESTAANPEKGYSKLTWEAGRLADYYGINAYEIHGIIPWLAACYENDVLDEDEIDIPLDEIGGRKFIQKLLKKIAYREGFGDQLAEGCQRAATSLGGKAEELMHPLYPRAGNFGGYREHWLNYGGFPGGYAIPHLALFWALDNRDATVSHNLMSQLWGAATSLGYSSQMAVADKLVPLLRPVMKYAYGSEDAAEFFTSDGKGLRWDWSPRVAKRFFERTILKDSYIVCDVAFPFLYNPNTKNHVGDSTLESSLFSAVTGVEMSEDESYQAGNKLCTLERAIQVREGRTRDDDILRDVCFTNKDLAGRQYRRKDLEQAKSEFYKLFGWDQRGIPTAETLETLKLSDVADDLKKRRILSPDGREGVKAGNQTKRRQK
jgi:aldehyde:ferredoxin oxidoreductase